MSVLSDSPLLYSELEEWKGITPIPQAEEGFAPLAPILYSDEYKDATSYFRAIIQKQEYSKRVLDLTEHIIRLNASHYTVWQYRYDTLIATNADLDVELKLMDELAIQYLKTYQVWHHRRLLLSHVRKPKYELDFIAIGLQEDAKNYHTWAYRQWVLAEFNESDLWAGEINFIERMLSDDIRNNSAWHHRFFVVWNSGIHLGDDVDREELLKREINFVKFKISTAPNNPSAWNYLRGILEFNSTAFSTLETFVGPYAAANSIPKNPDSVLDLENPLPSHHAELPCPQAIEFLADIFEEKMRTASSAEEPLAEAQKLYDTLAKQHDPMRQKYWEFRSREAADRRPLAAVSSLAA